MVNTKKFGFFILLKLLFSGCALTTPEGTRELMNDIQKDKASLKEKSTQFLGKPIFLKVRSYPRSDDQGNFYGKQWILTKIGNEQIDLSSLLNDLP